MKHRLMILILLLAWVIHIHADNKIKVSDVTITPGGTGCIVIDLDNSDVFTAFTMKLTLPNGISYVSFEKNDNRFSDHNVWDGVKNGQKMFGCLSGTNSAIIGNNGTLLTVNFSADESLNTGTELTATLSEITFATTSLTEQVLEDVNIKMTIKAKPKVTANNYTRVYGANNPTFTYTVSETGLAGTPTLSTTATKTSPVGEYPIMVEKGSVVGSFEAVNGTLTITKAPLSITAQSYVIKQGEALPEFGVTYNGFKNNEGKNALSKQPTITCAATSDSAVGAYDIIVSGAEAENYDINYVAGTLTIAEQESYMLRYVVDGEIYKTYPVKHKATITAEEEPTKEGYTFSGWSTIPATMPAKDVTVTGTFAVNSYKLTYIVDGEQYKSVQVNYGTAITPEAAPAKEGYTFSGWSLIPATMPAKDVTITGTFTVNSYKLTYMVDGEQYRNMQVNYGAAITPETNLEKEGYTFSGWSEMPASMPAKNVTVTGMFTINSYKLIYNVDGEQYRSMQVNYGAVITPEVSPEKEGYTFSGWSLIPATMPAKDVTITGSFTKGQYKLTYLVDGQTYKTVTMDFGAPIIVEAAPLKEGHTFSGWGEMPASMPAKDITVTGSFTINSYKLTYVVDGEQYRSMQVNYGAAITPEVFLAKEGYTFSGWSLIPTTMPAKDVVITGMFTVNTYKLTYMVDGEQYKSMQVNYGATITPEANPEKEGYTFSGWNLIPETMPAKDVTITGSFTKGQYKLTYTVDGQTYKTVSMDFGTEITPDLEPTKEGYTFSGWRNVPTTMPAEDVIVIGTFTINKYTLTYKVDEETYKTFDVEYGTDITAEVEPTKEGYTFSGWSLIPETMPAHDVIVTGYFTLIDAIEDVIADDGEYQIYSLDGKPIETLQKGVNIIRFLNGTTKSVYVK